MEKEIDFILSTAELYFVKPPRREDILCIFAGLRPLAANPDNPVSTKEVSRRHKITLSPSGLLTIIGGKWTTYRLMAEETIDKAIKAGYLKRRKCETSNLHLTESSERISSSRLHIYGVGLSEIEKLIIYKPELGLPVDSRLPYSRAEIIWICRNEMPMTIEDILARRTRALFLDARASFDMASVVAQLMGDEFGYGPEWENEQIKSYSKLVQNYILKR